MAINFTFARKSLWTLAASIFWASNARAEFRQIPAKDVKPCAVELDRAKGIQYRCLQYVDSDAPLPVWQNSLGFSFGQLSERQYAELRDRYGNWHAVKSAVGWEPQREYHLIDFLPPVIQALNRHQFIERDLQLDACFFPACLGILPQT